MLIKAKNQVDRYRLIGLILWVCAVCFISACKNIEPPKAVNGTLDLSQWNFQTQGNVYLRGQWEFYWQQLLDPDDFSDEKLPVKTGMIDVPSFWNGLKAGKSKLKGDGYATLRLKVSLPPGSKNLAIRLEDQATAYRLWVNGHPMPGNGVVADNREQSVPQYMVRISSLPAISDTLELVLQVSNYSLNLGGPYRSVLLGNKAQIEHYQSFLWAIDLISFGILFAIGIYHLVFFLLRKKDVSLLCFGSICLLLAVRILFWGTQGKYITILFPDFPWELAHKIESLSWYLVVPLMLMFGAALFPDEKSMKTIRFSQIVAVIAAIIVLICPARISNLILIPYEVFAVLNIVFMMQILVPAVLRKRENAVPLLSGFIIFLLSAVNELLNEYYVIRTGFLIHIGMVAMILVHAFVLARRFSTAFETIEYFSMKLKRKNAALSRSLDTVRNSYQALKDNVKLKAELKDQKQKEQEAYLKAEKETLEKLRYQLNPHFLFNALASIRGAVGLDADVARQMITQLSEFCRLTLDQGRKWLVTIEESIAINRLYLDMECLRLGSYLAVDIYAPKEILNQKIPTNLLQPLVENAVKYGRLTSPQSLRIKVKFESRNAGRIRLEVANTGTWITPGPDSHSTSTNIGLENVQNQLERLYPNDHSFVTREEDGWVMIRIEIPGQDEEKTLKRLQRKFMKAIIIDDEPFVREDLKQILKKHGDVEILGEAGTVPQAKELLRQVIPDVVFLDIQLVGGSGFDLTASIHPLSQIIFFTSHDEFAVRAFEVNALDYLLKPVAENRLASALDRLRNAVQTSPATLLPKESFNETDRIFIHTSGEQRFVYARDVVAVTSIGGNYTRVHIKDRTSLTVRRTMKQWENLMPESLFFRIHRVSIVNLEYVDCLRQTQAAGWIVQMLDLEKPLEVSRRSLPRIKLLLKEQHTGVISRQKR